MPTIDLFVPRRCSTWHANCERIHPGDELQESPRSLATPLEKPRHERPADGQLHKDDREYEREREDRFHQAKRSPGSGGR